MAAPLGLLATMLFLAAAGLATAGPEDQALADLKNPDPDIRVAGLRELLTSPDPRIPEAVLPLLRDEGNSIRRLAARAVGSRWWQIPEERRKAFTAALARNARSEFNDEQNMVQRGLGLLRRDHRGPMFARSPDKRWVVYERLNLPCIIDTSNGTEELVGWTPEREAWFGPSWGNGETAGCVLWHPGSDMVALDMLVNRKANAVWVWRPGRPARKIGPDEIVAALGPVDGEVLRSGGVFFEAKKWDGHNLLLEANYTVMKGETFTDWTATLSWNAQADRVTAIAQSRVN